MTLMYGNLSYRRKFVRTLWAFAVFALVTAALFAFDSTMRTSRYYIFAAVIAVIFIIQASYAFVCWQGEEGGKVD
jgi:hypothetical protein